MFEVGSWLRAQKHTIQGCAFGVFEAAVGIEVAATLEHKNTSIRCGPVLEVGVKVTEGFRI
jgi:hypothetical protein